MDKIYELIDPILGVPRYVGYTKNPIKDRLDGHISRSLRLKCTFKEKWIVSLIRQDKKPTIRVIKYLPKSIIGTWQDWETYYIAKYRELGYPLTNGTDGGEGVTMTPELKAKISATLKGIKRSEETKLKISTAKRGISFSEEHKYKLKVARKDRVISEVQKAKTSVNKVLRGRVGELNPNVKPLLLEYGENKLCLYGFPELVKYLKGIGISINKKTLNRKTRASKVNGIPQTFEIIPGYKLKQLIV